MIINLLNLYSHSNKIKNDYKGSFSSCNFETVSSSAETNCMYQVLKKETKFEDMDNKQLSEDIKVLIQRHLNDIERLSKLTGKPVEVIKNFLNGNLDLPESLFENTGKDIPKQEYIQLGDKIEVNNMGDNYSGMLQGIQTEDIKKLKDELSDFKKLLKEKDELIESLKENIKLLEKSSK